MYIVYIVISMFRLMWSILNKQPSLPIRKFNNSWATIDTEKANIFACHLASVFNPHANYPKITQLKVIDPSLETPPLTKVLPWKHTSKDLAHHKKILPSKRAPGYEQISNQIVKKLTYKYLILLSLIVTPYSVYLFF